MLSPKRKSGSRASRRASALTCTPPSKPCRARSWPSCSCERLQATLANAYTNVPLVHQRLDSAGRAAGRHPQPGRLSPRCRSPSRPICATSIRSACSPGRTTSWRGCTPRRAPPASPRWSATPLEDIDNWADLMARSLYSRRRAPRRRGAQRLRLRPVHRRPGRALRRRAAGRGGGAGVGRIDRAPGRPDHGLQGAGAVRHAFLCAGDRRGGRAAGRRPAQERAADRHVRRRALELGHAQGDRGAHRPEGGGHLRPVRDHGPGRRLRMRMRRTACTAGRTTSCSR